jgi:hypothetical protein
MDNSIIFQNGQNKARFPARLGKHTVEVKEREKVARDEDKQDNALKPSPSRSLLEQKHDDKNTMAIDKINVPNYDTLN